MRAIARRAGVDPALVHHYFASKSELFMATVNMRRDPSDIFDEVHTSPGKGEALIRAFLQEWEPLPGRCGPSPFVTIMQAVVLVDRDGPGPPGVSDRTGVVPSTR